MDEQRVQEIRARLKAATRGPWEWDGGALWQDGGDEEVVLAAIAQAGLRITKADADLIAHAPTDLADLLDEREKLLAANELQRGEIEHLRGFATLVDDLDRNEHGRHEGDADVYDPTGVSQGNPHIRPGDVFAYDLTARPYRIPDRAQRNNPAAYRAATTGEAGQ